MTFLQPLALFGILAIVFPLALYFLGQSRARQVPWAASALLKAALERVPGGNKKGERNLVLLRCLIIFLLCLTFSRPVVNFEGTQTRMASGQARAVIVLDDSGSMMFRKGARSSFEEAKEAASRIIRNLEGGSSVALCAASGPEGGTAFKFEPDGMALRQKLQETQAGENAGDLLPGIRAAVNLLAGQGGARGEIFVVTDNQTQAWKRIAEVQSLLGKHPDILFQVVGVGESAANNLAVTGMVLDGTVPAAGRSIGSYATVSNFGETAAENIRVTLRVDNLPVSDQAYIARLDPGKSATVRLSGILAGTGAHSLTAAIPTDALEYDNERSVAVETLRQMDVLIVEGTNVPIATDRDGYFLAHALAPVSPEQKKAHYLQVSTLISSELEGPGLKQYGIIILSNVSKLSPSVAQALAAFVEDGGGLAVFPGPNTDLLYYNSDRIFSALLPARLGTPQNAPADQKFIPLQKGPFGPGMMSAWKDQPPESLGTVHYKSFFPLTLPEGVDKSLSNVVLALADGRPAVVEKKKGEGRVILFNSTATPRWNNLPLHPAFVPLVQSMAGYLDGKRNGGLVLSTGQPFVRGMEPDEAGKDFKIRGPQGMVQGRIEKNGSTAALKFADTGYGGVYSVFVGGSVRPDFVFAVQPDPLESDLRKMPQRELEGLKRLSGEQPGTRLVIHQKTGHELWMELGLLILVLAMAEVFLAYHLNRRTLAA